MNRTRLKVVVCGAAFTVLLGGCGGGNNSGNATIGGTVTGLAAGTSVSLTDNGGTPLVVSSNSNFTFSGTVSSNNSYNVLVSTQPVGQTCLVTYGSGIINFAGSDINNVTVSCSANVPIGVQVTGLTSGNDVTFTLTLQNDTSTGYNVKVASDGTVNNFPVLLPLGEIYGVTVALQPGQSLDTNNNVIGTPVQTCGLATNSSGGVITPSSGGVVNSTAIVIDYSCVNAQ